MNLWFSFQPSSCALFRITHKQKKKTRSGVNWPPSFHLICTAYRHVVLDAACSKTGSGLMHVPHWWVNSSTPLSLANPSQVSTACSHVCRLGRKPNVLVYSSKRHKIKDSRISMGLGSISKPKDASEDCAVFSPRLLGAIWPRLLGAINVRACKSAEVTHTAYMRHS
jgi:hypothetical protein